MSEYTTESPRSVAARQRRRRALITIGVVLLGLFFAFWYGLSYYQADEQRRDSRVAAPTCQPFDPDVLLPEDVTVDVFNSTKRNGLAASTAKAIEGRGFAIGKIANDPRDGKAPAVAEVRHGPAGEAQAKLVMTVMPEGTELVAVDRKGNGVAVAVGTKFKNLAPAATPSGLPTCPPPTEEG
ncbi:LytR C-terminal domain-containing protein [Phycicoccus sp. CSK15P-2]|uniref:LytR C-terminal domain-containing protein n=1 Tax=Phycicoccus sp. CSK15P-2 TaxID=2807627 RepID=UPI001950545F|nr:LytR C-terminal domain-containing protein [Phycicoccus sp. CSK15P-2]MBM6404502.1 LytR C-terminal domain-containing protein [Phycicoccus sp. CSK15P-2]